MKQQIYVNTKGVYASYSYDETPPSVLDTQHCHDEYEILYIASGVGVFLVEGETFDVKPGTLLLIKPFAYHSIKLVGDEPYERYVINFSTSGLMNETADILDRIFSGGEDGCGWRCYSPRALPQDAYSLFERFSVTIPMRQTERVIYARALISEMILLLSLSNGVVARRNDDELGARVIRYLNDNIDKNISLDKLAKRFFVSKYYLCRAFKSHNGISIHGYINQKRVMYAKQLIESGVTASAAAYRVGFGDYSSFYRAYVKVLGKSPTAT